MERVATQPGSDPHNAGGRQGAASAVLRTVGDQQQTVLVLDGRRLPRKSGRFPWSFFGVGAPAFLTLGASLRARATRPTRCAGRCTRSGSRCALHSAGLPEPGRLRGAGTASPTSSSGVLGLPATRRRAELCRRLTCGTPWVKLVVSRWGG